MYARRAFGDWVGFVIGWNDWIAYTASLSYISIGMSEFLGKLVPPVAGAVRPVAIALLAGFVVLQWAGVRVGSWFQSWTTALKCVAFQALVAVGLVMSGGVSGAAPAAASVSPTLIGLVVALQAIVNTFGGWQSALYFTEEDRDPVRNLPRAMIGACSSSSSSTCWSTWPSWPSCRSRSSRPRSSPPPMPPMPSSESAAARSSRSCRSCRCCRCSTPS